MSSNKVKVFLYAHINNIGAFNLNCRTIAEFINKEQFEIYTLSLGSGKLKIPKIKGVQIFHCFYPAKFSNFLGILWGIYNCDVAYIARTNNFKFVHFLLKVLNKKSIKRQGNILDKHGYLMHLSLAKTSKMVPQIYNFHSKVFAPSQYVGQYNLQNFDIKFDPSIFLPPLINTNQFNRKFKFNNLVNSAIFIGNDMIRKGIDEYLQLAVNFPKLTFHIVGSGLGETGMNERVKKLNIRNVIYHGQLKPDELNTLLEEIDLHILPSRSEGFGKVTIETALVGIPSIVYNTYGASEWLVDNEEGFIVESFEELCEKLKLLTEDSSSYKKLVKGTLNLTSRFKVEKRIIAYQEVFKDLIND